MTRLAIGGLVHETVSFLPEETTLADFERRAGAGGSDDLPGQGANGHDRLLAI